MWSCEVINLNNEFYLANYDENNTLRFYSGLTINIIITIDEFNIMKNRVELLNEIDEN